MATLTAAQARALADAFRELAAGIARARFEHWEELAEPERVELEEAERRLIGLSSDLTATAIEIAIADVGPMLARIEESTRSLRDALGTLDQARKVVAIAGAAVGLGVAIAGGGAEAIASAVARAAEVIAS